MNFEEALNWTEKELALDSGGPWFFGDHFTIVDVGFSSVIERAYATAYYYKGRTLFGTKWPHIDVWLRSLAQRPSYRACCSDIHTHAHIHASLGRWGPCSLPCGCVMKCECPTLGDDVSRSFAAQQHVDELKLFQADGSLAQPAEEIALPGVLLRCADNQFQTDCLEAAFALVKHHSNIIARARHFVLQEQEGMSCEEHVVDSLYRAVASALINVAEIKNGSKSPAVLLQQGLEETIRAVLSDSCVTSNRDAPCCTDAAICLRYTADRISVPRDMGAPAARALRGSLVYAANLVDGGTGETSPGGRIPIPFWDRRDQDPVGFYASS